MSNSQAVDPARAQAGHASSVPAVAVREATRVFRKGNRSVEALASVDMSVAHGEFVALVGPSGCGKSTLLRNIAGLLPLSGGHIDVNGMPLRGPRHEIGLMLQHPTLLAWRTITQNVLLPVEIRRKPTPADKQRAADLVRLVGLERFAGHYPKELSGGMQQRVSLARVLILSPELMLLDEPFGALDEFTRETLNLELADMVTRARVSVILVTHNITEAVLLADRVIAMSGHPGRIAGEVLVEEPRPREVTWIRSPAAQQRIAAVRNLLGLD
jgi:NitT/TauT family transport system ATP-binding protein